MRAFYRLRDALGLADNDASSLAALGEEIEEQLTAGAIEGHEAQLIEHRRSTG